MALIQCKNCGKEISDKATNCPNCGEPVKAVLESSVSTILPTTCHECGAEIPASADVCLNCGCPREEKREEDAKKSETVAQTLNVQQPAKKYITAVIAAVAVIIILIIGMNVHNSNKEERARQEYLSDLEQVTYTMLTGAADAESAGNLIKSVWYNSIYEEKDSTTDKYTRTSYGTFYDDFNMALGLLFVDDSFSKKISSIEKNQETVASMMKSMVNPPEGMENAYQALKEYYDAYLELTGMVINPKGSLQTFSSNFNTADTEAAKCYKAMKLYID